MKLNKILISILIIGMITAIGCSAKYSPPTHTDPKGKYETIINAPYDEVWSRLIQYSAKTFFAIDNYEKDSGLITLSFGASNPERFVTGGYWEYKDPRPAKQIDFAGDYVEFLSKYGNGELNGKMNIVITEISETKTKIRVNARYIFSSPTPRTKLTWSFDTGSCDTIKLSNQTSAAGTGNHRTICPTYKVENEIIDAVNKEFKE